MGLALRVGMLVDLADEDPEGFEHHAFALRRLNRLLVQSGLPAHDEPEDCEPWDGEMISYSGLHDLRRVAAYLDCGEPLPPPARGPGASDDACLEGYFAVAEADDGGRRPGLFARLFGKKPRYRRGFDHLLLHSDAEGYYLPIDFAEVLFAPLDLEIPGVAVGSAPRLLAELERIAAALRIPDHLTAQSDELWEASDDPPEEGETWRRYGRESFGCVTLREGCRHAIAQRAALVFT